MALFILSHVIFSLPLSDYFRDCQNEVYNTFQRAYDLSPSCRMNMNHIEHRWSKRDILLSHNTALEKCKHNMSNLEFDDMFEIIQQFDEDLINAVHMADCSLGKGNRWDIEKWWSSVIKN